MMPRLQFEDLREDLRAFYDAHGWKILGLLRRMVPISKGGVSTLGIWEPYSLREHLIALAGRHKVLVAAAAVVVPCSGC